MKKIILITLYCTSIAFCSQAQLVKIFYEQIQQGYTIYASNAELYPVSVSLNLNLSNLLFSEGRKKIFVIPPATSNYKVGDLTVAEVSQRHSFNYTFKTAMGDVTISNYDKLYHYDLPYKRGKQYEVIQGYNGSFSHTNQYALDFSMPEESEVVAARGGVAVKVVINNTKACASDSCKAYNNYIIIMHSDKTFAYYAHIKHNGTSLHVGDSVKQGDVIAYSGNVGWSAGPHLHFMCFTPGFGNWNTIETMFSVNNGDTAILLKKGDSYLRAY